jgi:hypothetical protein
MLDIVGPKGLLSIMRPALPGRRYLKDLPEAIKAHLARAGAAKPTGVKGISEFEFRISELQKGTDRSLRVGDFDPDCCPTSNPQSEFRNPKFFEDLAGLPKAGEAFPHSVKWFSCSVLLRCSLVFPAEPINP